MSLHLVQKIKSRLAAALNQIELIVNNFDRKERSHFLYLRWYDRGRSSFQKAVWVLSEALRDEPMNDS